MISTPIHSGTWWTIARAVVCALVVIYLIAPMIIVLIISFSSAPFLTFPPPGFSLQWFRKLFGHAAWQDALLTSLQIMLPTGISKVSIARVIAACLSLSFADCSLLRSSAKACDTSSNSCDIATAPIVAPRNFLAI